MPHSLWKSTRKLTDGIYVCVHMRREIGAAEGKIRNKSQGWIQEYAALNADKVLAERQVHLFQEEISSSLGLTERN